MSRIFRTVQDYERFIYGLADEYSAVLHTTLSLVRRGSTLARVSGEVHLAQDYRLIVRERLSFDRLPLRIDAYGYEVWKGENKLYWYDSQPHPKDETLQSSHPHHKHVPPDMKHTRKPAPLLSFDHPNLPAIIDEIVALQHDED